MSEVDLVFTGSCHVETLFFPHIRWIFILGEHLFSDAIVCPSLIYSKLMLSPSRGEHDASGRCDRLDIYLFGPEECQVSQRG